MSIPTSDVEWAALISTQEDMIPDLLPVYPIPSLSTISRVIDHTQLAPSATDSQIDALCAEAQKYKFATVCVRLGHVARAVQNLKDTPAVGVACVVGFHEGTYPTSVKVDEARNAAAFGASELDMVINYPLLKEGKYTSVYEDVVAVRRAAPSPVQLKVILETSQLSRDEIIAGSVISCIAGAGFLKTSTGFNGPGASVENVSLMRASIELLGKGCKVKASGGVRTAEDCLAMLRAGADRIGASAGVKIMKELEGDVPSKH
jgi:deoxyribose-phosphate aldolase